MRSRPLIFAVAATLGLIWVGQKWIQRRPFAPDTAPDGAYARIALCIAERHPREAFAYLETEAQWATYTIAEMRKKACDLVQASYPPTERQRLLSAWQEEAQASDAPDEFVLLATRRGWIGRLERDLSGVAHVEIQGERATVVTARGTRYPFRRRDNGIWGITVFTAELQAEAERASRDLEVVKTNAEVYGRAAAQP